MHVLLFQHIECRSWRAADHRGNGGRAPKQIGRVFVGINGNRTLRSLLLCGRATKKCLTGSAGFDLMRTLFRGAPIGRVLKRESAIALAGSFAFLSRSFPQPANLASLKVTKTTCAVTVAALWS